MKLRHHRGPLFTVPFGVLGAVQNVSRDWVSDKLTIGVSYDSDFDKAKKLIKQIGKELAEDPDSRPTSSSRSRCRASINSAITASRSASR